MGLGDNEVSLELWQEKRTKVGKLRLDFPQADTQYAVPTLVLHFRGATWDRTDVPSTTRPGRIGSDGATQVQPRAG